MAKKSGRLRINRKVSFYTCGRCSGSIRYFRTRPSICPQCGYGHGEVPVNSVPPEVIINPSNR